MPAKAIAGAVGAVLVAILLTACSGSDDEQSSTPLKFTAAKCIKLMKVPLPKEGRVQLKAKAKWAKGAKSPIRAYVFQLVNTERDAEPATFKVPTNRARAEHTFWDIKPGKYSARVTLETTSGIQPVRKKCRDRVVVR